MPATAVVALLLGTAPFESLAQREIFEYDEAEIFLEENRTDGDLGVHFLIDGEPWDRAILLNRFWQRLVDLHLRGSAGVIGLTELFSESAEPSFDELPREDFLALFPEGNYYFLGTTVEGNWLFAVAELTHTMPDPPKILAPVIDAVVDSTMPFTIQWEAPEDPEGSEFVAVQVVVEKDEDEERLRVLSADMTPDDTTLTLAPGLLEAGTAYKVEILFEEESGNKIISEREFETTDA